MAQVASNADDYSATRLGFFFPGSISSLDGQCVSLVKWFIAEMTGIPNPQAARGDARYFGKRLVAEGLADEVPYANRRRGDIICYEYGTYGHIAVQLSGGRVFEENVNWPGVSSKVVDGARVYASRIGSEGESWRRDEHVYRIKSYNEKGDIPMFNEGDRKNMIAYFGADNNAWLGAVGKDWKSAMYEIMEDNRNHLRLTFNEGDRSNLNFALYGKDKKHFSSQVGKSWKNAVYDALGEVGFKTDQLINAGDIVNLKTIIGTSNIPSGVVGKAWKDFVYQDLKGLIPEGGNAEQVLEQVRQLVNSKLG